MNKVLLLASFIFHERKVWLLNHLKDNFKVKPTDIFIYENLTDTSKLIVVFKITLTNGKQLNFKDLFPSAVQIHKKGNCLYSINALNKLIDELSGNPVGTIDYKSYKLDWSSYQNKLILTSKQGLVISDIKQVF